VVGEDAPSSVPHPDSAPKGSEGSATATVHEQANHDSSGDAAKMPALDGESGVSKATEAANGPEQRPAQHARRQVLGTDPKRGYIDYEGLVGEEIEDRFGGFDRDLSGAGEWIGKSGGYKGKSFDLLGLPPEKAQFHRPTMERFLPSIDAHFLKKIDYIVLDTRFMAPAQKQAVLDYINSKWSAQMERLIVL